VHNKLNHIFSRFQKAPIHTTACKRRHTLIMQNGT
jgi:hypothetical protein